MTSEGFPACVLSSFYLHGTEEKLNTLGSGVSQALPQFAWLSYMSGLQVHTLYGSTPQHINNIDI